MTNIDFEIKIDVKNAKSKVLKASGSLYLTNIRTILVNKIQN